MIPAEAVEAAAKAMADVDPLWPDGAWETMPDELREQALGMAGVALEAAAPHMLRGDGDYRPGWDDRKTLSSLWQEHAPLPDEGLSERVYEALIAVATWGYQQRKDEEL